MSAPIIAFPIDVKRVPELPALVTPLDDDQMVIWKSSDDTTYYIKYSDLKVAFGAGTATQIPYYDAGGELVGDTDFYRDPVSGITYIRVDDPGNIGVNYARLILQTGVAAIAYTEGDVGSNIQANGTGAYMYSADAGSGNNVKIEITPTSIRFITNLDSYEFPLIDGNSGDVQTTDGAGILLWTSPGGMNFSAIPAFPDNATAVSAIGAGKLYYTDVAGEYIVKLSH